MHELLRIFEPNAVLTDNIWGYLPEPDLRVKKITSVEVLPNNQLRLRFDDGVAGVVNLSAEVGQGVFAPWTDAKVFASVKIGRAGRALIWSDEIDLCADALYLEITGQRAEDLFPGLKPAPVHA